MRKCWHFTSYEEIQRKAARQEDGVFISIQRSTRWRWWRWRRQTDGAVRCQSDRLRDFKPGVCLYTPSSDWLLGIAKQGQRGHHHQTGADAAYQRPEHLFGQHLHKSWYSVSLISDPIINKTIQLSHWRNICFKTFVLFVSEEAQCVALYIFLCTILEQLRSAVTTTLWTFDPDSTQAHYS